MLLHPSSMHACVLTWLAVCCVCARRDVTVPGLLEKAQRLSPAEQLELYRILAQILGVTHA